MKSIVSEPRWRNMFVTSTLSSVMNAASGVLNAICDGTALRYSSPRDCFIFVVSCGWPAINLVETRCWHVTISCQPDGRPPQPVRPWKSGRVHLAGRGQQCSCFRTRNTFCRTQSLSNATFSFFDHVMKIWWFYTEIWRYIDFQNGGRPPSWNCFATIRDRSQSLLLATAACKISCQSDAHIWRYFAQLAWLAYSGPQNGGFGPPNVIIHHRYSQKAHPCVHSRLLSYQLKIRWGVWPVGKLTESGTHRHTHTGKFIFCPCVALDRQWSNNRWLMDVLYC